MLVHVCEDRLLCDFKVLVILVKSTVHVIVHESEYFFVFDEMVQTWNFLLVVMKFFLPTSEVVQLVLLTFVEVMVVSPS